MRLVGRVRITPCEKSTIPARVSAETGFYTLQKDGKRVAFQSSVERSFVQLCDFANEVQTIRWEPFTLLFDDLVDQQERRYTPDYLVETVSRSGDRLTHIVEIKPEAEINRIWVDDPHGVGARRHVAMMTWCSQNKSTRFTLISEKLMSKKGLPNMVAILDRKSFSVLDSVRIGLLDDLKTQFPTTLAEMVKRGGMLGLSRSGLISSLLRLCADDELWFDVEEPLRDETVFNRGPRRRVFG